MRSLSTRRLARTEPATCAARSAPAGRTLFAAILALSIVLAAGCLDTAPSSPATASQPVAKINPPPPPPTLPTITAPSALFRRITPASYGSDSYLLSLAADSAFILIFPNGEMYGAWSGRYERADSVLIFHFQGPSPAGELTARGTLRGDTLLLRYDELMQMTDFEDGVYVRDPRGP